MTFLGWKLSTGEVVRSFENDKGYTIVPGQHEANKLREAIGYKGRMTPQYQ